MPHNAAELVLVGTRNEKFKLFWTCIYNKKSLNYYLGVDRIVAAAFWQGRKVRAPQGRVPGNAWGA